MFGRKKNIKNILTLTIWCIIGIGTVVLSIAAINKKKHQLCKGYEIEIAGEDQMFIDKKNVEEMLFSNVALIMDRPVSSFDLNKMEEKLKTNAWVKSAQIFFSNEGILKINVKERQPVARVFTVTGSSYYVDSSCAQLPLSDKQSARLPVFTNFPTDRKKLNRADSLLMRQVASMSAFINQNEFWSAQVAQVDITSSRTFELIPLVGNHVVALGDGSDIDKKFNRLFIFYSKVLSKTGFNYYQKLDVQFAGQVVATKKPATLSKKDSLLAVKKVKELIAEARDLKPDTLMQGNVKPVEKLEVNEQTLKNYDLVPADTLRPEVRSQNSEARNQEMEEKKEREKKNEKQQPKAVMKKGFR